MIELENFNKISTTVRVKYQNHPSKVLPIIFAPPTDRLFQINLLNNLNHYHHKTHTSCDFFIAGYGAYLYGEGAPDLIDVITVDHTPWSFSNLEFNNMIRSIELLLPKWKYNNGTEILLLNVENGNILYDKFIHISINDLVANNVLHEYRIGSFMQDLINALTTYTTITAISNSFGANNVRDEIGLMFKSLSPFDYNRYAPFAIH